MEIQIGSLIEHQDGLMKGIIVNHWTEPNPLYNGWKSRLYQAFHGLRPLRANCAESNCNFQRFSLASLLEGYK